MADEVYNISALTAGGDVTLNDDGIGIDTLFFPGVTFLQATDIRLAWTSASGTATSASAFYFNDAGASFRLVVNGQIENVRGSSSADFISGNELGNLLMGDGTLTGPGGNDSISGATGNDTIHGGSGADLLGGDGGNDSLTGGAGTDTITGGAGIDTIVGGAGADSLSGGTDRGDLLSYAGSNTGVRVAITFGQTTVGAGGHAAGDSITGFGNVSGSGFGDLLRDTVTNAVAFGGNANRFFGQAGNDVLLLGGGNDAGRGGIGNDTIAGGRGADVLAGDAGRDVFDFNAIADSTVAAAGRDTIIDLRRSEGDKIDLRDIDAISGGAVNDAFTFIGARDFTGAAGELRAVATASGFVILGNVNTGLAADFAILVDNILVIGPGDFLL